MQHFDYNYYAALQLGVKRHSREIFVEKMLDVKLKLQRSEIGLNVLYSLGSGAFI